MSERLSNAELARLLDTIEDLEKIFEAVKRHAIERVHAGAKIGDWEPEFTTPRRAWDDEEEANAALTKLGLDKRERYSIALLSPAQAEDVLKKKGKWPKKPRGTAAADFTDPFAGLLADKKGNPTIKRKTG